MPLMSADRVFWSVTVEIVHRERRWSPTGRLPPGSWFSARRPSRSVLSQQPKAQFSRDFPAPSRAAPVPLPDGLLSGKAKDGALQVLKSFSVFAPVAEHHAISQLCIGVWDLCGALVAPAAVRMTTFTRSISLNMLILYVLENTGKSRQRYE